MGWKNFFTKKKKRIDPLTDLTLSKLAKGYFVDFDMKSWHVDGCHYYDWGSGDLTYEWQLSSHDDVIYLERESDDEDLWSISRKIPIGKIGFDLKAHMLNHDDPPDQFEYEGTTYYMDETSAGKFFKDGEGPGKELLLWDYVDDSGKLYLTIEQWGETEFEASVGQRVEEYQFDNILPSNDETA